MDEKLISLLDGSKEERETAMKKFFGLSPEQTFEDLEVDVETDLTDEEKETIRCGRKEYESGNFVPLDSLN